MLRKSLIISIAGLLIISFTNIAWGWIGGNSFDVSETIKIRIFAKKAGSASDTGTGYEKFFFNSNGSFYMNNMGLSGTWSEVKKKFTANISYEDIEADWHDILEESFSEALDYMGCWNSQARVDGLVLTKYSFKGTESKDERSIKGKFSFNTSFSLFLYCDGDSLDTTGKTTFTNSFTGWKSTPSPDADALSTDSSSFSEMLGKAVYDIFLHRGNEGSQKD